MWVSPWSSCHGTRKMTWRSGSQMRSMIFCSASSGCLAITGPSDSSTSRTAWWNSTSPGLRFTTSANTPSSFSSITAACSSPWGPRQGKESNPSGSNPPLRDGDDLDGEDGARGGLELHLVADLLAHQRLAERRARADDVVLDVALLDGPVEVRVDVVVALVAELHGGAGLDEIGREHVGTPVNNAHLVCRLLLEKKNTTTCTQGD